MRFIRNLTFIALLAIIGFYFLEKSNISPDEAVSIESNMVEEKISLLENKVAPEEKRNIPLQGEIYDWMGKSPKELVQALGEPLRKDLSAYEYTWWVYTDQSDHYVQFGVVDNEIITIYATGDNLNIESVAIGQHYNTVSEELTFSDEVTYSKGFSFYTFRLSEEDLQMRPLVKVSDEIFIQCYFDTFSNVLSSVRVLTADTLLKHRPYELEYRGDLPGELRLSDEQWAEVESGMEQQIFDLTNVMRNQHDKQKLDWEEAVSNVAFLHSEDMAENNYFSHYSKNGADLQERLATKDIFYMKAGENIAAQYPDAPAAMEGWLNSDGHREALLKDEYTHLGVGVYRLYYTQNFLSKP
ncbi:hypothetical protein CIL05_08400 [Virgibacillus profundi]|uniref:CAP domain-containing protein n=1 Tax=Virgibacillus profundi TaxID=2024555 RepID=A0A2A2IFF6_9BACI|nr:CAP domain-containing protein [Virgibacillus profundi]PAV29890.1 hypothetical protein CIL05_08400 [Virgibacillus profundi]PXY54062.1 hypothetical protein CIT14_08485 [Virgibacillus profundi]